MIEVEQITIVGTGLLGGSIGLALRAKGYRGRIVGVGRNAATVQRARDRGCIDQGLTRLDQGVAGSKLIVLATPINTILDLLPQLSACAEADTVITDVGSTKAQIVAAVNKTLKYPDRFVGSHPMAGTERTGPDAARVDLLERRPCIITPQSDTSPHALEMVESFWSALGMRLIRMTAQEHDRAVAAVSHLPHALAALLVLAGANSGRLDVASSGFRDTTRVASGDPNAWADIFVTNRAAVAEQLDQLIEALRLFRTHLAAGDAADLYALLSQAKQTRDRWMQTFEPGGE